EAHPDKSKRYIAAIFAGIIYIIFGTFATTFVTLFSSLPKEAVAALAGLALLTAIASSFDSAFVSNKGSLAPLVVFVMAASGFTMFGIGAAFWAIVAGIFIFHVLEKKSTSA
ncbi:MAG: benzoate transporter, partial [Moraxellaceae bacterium]